MKFFAKKTLTGLIPVYNSDYETLKECKLKIGDVYEIEVKKKRNYEFHKKYFALINLCFENQELFETIEELRYYLTMKSGYYRKVETPKGEMYLPKSISFSNMDEIEFDKLYQKTITEVMTLLGVDDKTDLLNELINFM